MKSLALAIHSYPGANQAVARHWPYYKNAGADIIFGIGTFNGGCLWPDGVVDCEIGDNKYIEGDHLPKRLIATIELVLRVAKSDSIAVIEYDTIFFEPIPRELPVGLVAHLAGGSQPGRKGAQFFHNPWIMDRRTAERIVEAGNQMIAEGDIENGSPDCFIGWLCERFDIAVHFDQLRCYSRNSLDIPQQLEEARRARINGAVAIHGVKTEAMLRRLNED